MTAACVKFVRLAVPDQDSNSGSRRVVWEGEVSGGA